MVKYLFIEDVYMFYDQDFVRMQKDGIYVFFEGRLIETVKQKQEAHSRFLGWQGAYGFSLEFPSRAKLHKERTIGSINEPGRRFCISVGYHHYSFIDAPGELKHIMLYSDKDCRDLFYYTNGLRGVIWNW